jgi:transglutaminase-like putative cysteine protease
MNAKLKLTALSAVATLLASASLSAVYDDGGWFGQTFVAVVVAAACCALGRRIGLPRLVVPLLGLLGVAFLLTWVYAKDDAVFGFFPGPGAVRSLNSTALLATRAAAHTVAPVAVNDGFVLLTAAGVAAVALLVDTLAVGFGSAAMSGIPLLALYAVPVTVSRTGVPWPLFAVGALGWLALMLVEGRERLSAWGRTLGSRRRPDRSAPPVPGQPAQAEPLGLVGRRIGAAALGLAVVVPVFVPGLSTSLFASGGSGGTGAGKGTGGAATVTLNPFVSIKGDLLTLRDEEALRYTTDDTAPDYLRMVTLDAFNGSDWTFAPLDSNVSAGGPLTPLAGLTDLQASGVPSRPTQTSISVTGLRNKWLPLPYPYTQVDGLDGSWRYDQASGVVFTNNGDSFREAYEVAGLHLDPTVEQLQSAAPAAGTVPARYLLLPAGIPAIVQQTAVSITAGKTSDFDKALALQNYFLDPANGFRYSLEVPQTKANPIAAFLTNKVGFCQQYAGTFAVMARMLGLPTRVDVGFTQGSKASDGSGWVVTLRNAHAWPEVYFSGIGWVRFEPTPGGVNAVGISGPAYAPQRGPSFAPGPGQHDTEHGSPTTKLVNRDARDAAAATSPEQAAATPVPTDSFPWRRVLAGVLLVALAIAPWATAQVRRRHRLGHRIARRWGHGPAVIAAWEEVADVARDLRLPWPVSRTPRGTLRWLRSLPVDATDVEAASRLVQAVEQVRYAPAELTSSVQSVDPVDPGRDDSEQQLAAGPQADARRVIHAMSASVPARVRWRARLVPASSLVMFSELAADVMAAVDRGLAAGTRVLRSVLPGGARSS